MIDTLRDNLEVVWGFALALAVVLLLTPGVGRFARILGVAIEHEAADLFSQLAAAIVTIYGRDTVSDLARASAHDEIRHAERCGKIVECCSQKFVAKTPELGSSLGPLSLSLRERTFSCVSGSDVKFPVRTET